MNAQTRRHINEQHEKDERAKREQEAMLRRLARRCGAVYLTTPLPLKYRAFEKLPEIIMGHDNR